MKRLTSSFPWRLWVLGALLVCFGSLAVFEPVLHAHELDPTHVEENCAPCHWSQNHASADLYAPDLTVFDNLFEQLSNPHESFSGVTLHSIYSRGPPALR